MRKTIIVFMAVSLILCTAPFVSASSSVLDDAYYIDGTFHEIVRESGGLVYYIDGVQQIALGIVFVNGNYYISRSSGYLVAGYSYEARGLTLNGYFLDYLDSNNAITLTCDSNGCIVDPPYYPENWEEQWSDTWPFPTEPPETEPPATEPPATDPPIFSEPSERAAFTIDIVGEALFSCNSWFISFLGKIGLAEVYLAVIFIILCYKFLFAPIFGSAGSDKVKRRKGGDDNG